MPRQGASSTTRSTGREGGAAAEAATGNSRPDPARRRFSRRRASRSGLSSPASTRSARRPSATLLPPGAAQAPQAAALGGFNLGHLWFLYYLLIFYALTLAIRWLVLAVDPRGAIAASCDRVVAFLMRGLWGPVLIALPIAAYLYQLESWTEWLGLPAPFLLTPDLKALIGYGVPFGLGWLLNRQVQALLDLQKIASLMRGDLLFDYRNLLNAGDVNAAGLRYASLGRPVRHPRPAGAVTAGDWQDIAAAPY